MDRLTETQQSLAVEAVARAKRIAERYAKLFPQHAEDFESCATWGAVRAASSYVPERNEVWDRWSDLCIRGEIKDFLGSAYLKRRTLWPQEALESVEVERGGDEFRASATASLDKILAVLPEKFRQLIGLVYRMGMTKRQAAIALGYSPNQGYKLHKEAIEILRKQLVA